MKQTRTLALLAMAAAVTATALTSPAEAFTGVASTTKASKATKSSEAARYAAVSGCTKHGYSVPCGPWRVTLRNGKTVTLSDATVYPRTDHGKVDKESAAPFAISGDGTRVVYFRKSDRKLVWQDLPTGRAHSLPGASAKVPKGVGMSDVDPTLSPDGDAVLIDYNDESGKLATLVVHLGSGEVAKLPGGDTVQGFSPDGRRILLSHFTGDNTTELAVYDTDGGEGESREVPQVVSNNSPIALADDGVTVAVVISPTSGKPRLRQYDLSTDAVSPAIDIDVPAAESPYRIDWDDSGKLTLWHLRSNDNDTVTRATASRIDPSNGDLKKVDSFKVRTNAWTWWLPGE
ncbi:hypothetical protein [Sphaerisporangium perillae]|uniref:hypothetical protein n=1 Tax=Sphaerisporangium perillae TaxID=2935860 RepID=UPI00200ECB34|nr:hypothetical protein [Sphaerisporangium perillae]